MFAEMSMKTVKRRAKYDKAQVMAMAGIVIVLIALLVGAFLIGSADESLTISEALADAVQHDVNKVSLFGLEVDPGVISALIVTAVLLIAALCIRIFVVPRFKEVPGKFQLLLEKLVGFFDGLATGNSPHHSGFLGCYIFSAGVYIAASTLFELLGIQVMTTSGEAATLPAPLADINAAIALGGMSYLVILLGGLFTNGVRGLGRALKEFSLPISMSFRLFGAMLSGLLVTELVYYTISLSIVLPVIVAVLFTLLHAIVQTYVLVMLTSMFYGEVTEPATRKKKRDGSKEKSKKASAAA